ncbi:MAG: helix-turn-helix domain-containing protein [Clostridia bacterium]|nr:helix-turn-helix domain-containing protein [Clostridia bacterium]
MIAKESFKNRLNKAMQIRNIKAVELVEKTNISKANISCYMSGKYEAKADGVKLLADALNINPVWLMGYDVPMDTDEKIDELGNPVVTIPILGVVKAGYDYLAQENWIGNVDVDKKLADGNELFALKVKGDSMFPVLVEDDIVIIKKQDDFETGDIVVAIVNSDEATIKKGKKTSNGILLQPLNTSYDPLIFTYDEMKTIPVSIVGIVKQLKREF